MVAADIMVIMVVKVIKVIIVKMVIMVALDTMVVMVVMVKIIRSSGQPGHTGLTGKKSQRRQERQLYQTFQFDFPGYLCRAAFAILAMFLENAFQNIDLKRQYQNNKFNLLPTVHILIALFHSKHFYCCSVQIYSFTNRKS